jgi:glycolate oxidase FAD binding subunit
MADNDCTQELLEQVRDARAAGAPVAPQGGNSKHFLGHVVQARTLSTAGHRGIVGYEPTELVVTARSGTSLAELEARLAENGQMLAFEPPRFDDSGTIGGTIACGLSGPRRPYAGAARDFVLGVRMVNGLGQALRFGGEVMKNVAGYDLSRLMTGSMGTLGLLLDVSMKVLPVPERTETRVFAHTTQEALRMLNEWASAPLPISGGCHLDGHTYLRLSGTEGGVASAVSTLGGEALAPEDALWAELREHRLEFFTREGPPLWRIALPSTTAPLALPGECLIDWGGGLRWLRSDADAGAVGAAGGHATAFRGHPRERPVFHPLPPAMLRLHQRVKAALDPGGLFNPGKMYPEI